jgi:hypothetical protein
VIAVGNYLIVSPSELGNYKIVDTDGEFRRAGLAIEQAVALSDAQRRVVHARHCIRMSP